jgi:septum formation protein
LNDRLDENAPAPSPRLVLASASPRRQQLLRDAGFEFQVQAADIDEDDVKPGTLPIEAAMAIASAKARLISARQPGVYVLAADTVVALGDQLIGKPEDPADAKEMLRLLSGTTQVVITAVVLARHEPPYRRTTRVMSSVRMRRLTELEIERYLATGTWRGKAGGYGLQDENPIVTLVAGCRTNVIGLPIPATMKLLAEAGIMPAPSAADTSNNPAGD